MAHAWKLDYGWQYGHSHRLFTYDLRGQIAPADLAPQLRHELRHRSAEGGVEVNFGGASARFADDAIIVSSSGEDACDSIEAATIEIADTLNAIAPTADITWTQTPPRSFPEGVPAVAIDGYWIPADEAPEYHRVRAAMIDRISEVAAGRLGKLDIEWADGRAALIGRLDGAVVADLGLGADQLHWLAESDEEGQLWENLG